MAGCLASAFCLSWLVFEVLTGGIGWLGFGISVFVTFLGLLWVVTADSIGPTAATDRVVSAIVVVSAFVIMVPLLWLMWFIVTKGIDALRLNFFVEDQRGITPTMPATAGGGAHAIVGTLEQVGLALLWSLPLGVLAAVFLNESRSRWRRPVRIVVDAMSGLPSIVAGLFIYAVLHPPVREDRAPVQLQRLHGQPRARDDHVADDHPHDRGRAPARSRWAPRSEPRHGCIARAHRVVGRVADRAHRDDHGGRTRHRRARSERPRRCSSPHSGTTS